MFIMCEVVYIALSLMYMVRSLCSHCFVMFRRLVVYSAERIGESRDPCGVPCVMPNGSDM